MLHARIPAIDSLLALASGLLLALAFPRPSLVFLAWCGLVPLLLKGMRRPFFCGWLAGCGFFALVLYWLNIVMTTYGRLHPILSVAAYLLLVAYLALFWGLALWGSARLQELLRLPLPLALPVLWVGLEYLRGHLLTGFPWALLGYSQQPWLPVLQAADLFGVYGLSFLLVLVNATLAEAVVRMRQKQGLPVVSLVVTGLLVTMTLGYGYWRLETVSGASGDALRVALAQGNIEQAQKWNPARQLATLEIYRGLTVRATTAGAELTIWPESATPFYAQEPGSRQQHVLDTARMSGGFLLFGSPAYQRTAAEVSLLNSAFLLSADGVSLGRSDKIHLVPFGEYVPLKWLLPFVDKLVVGIGDFAPGAVNPLSMNGYSLGVLVCYEAIFPELARDYVNSGSDLLVNITNDAWFGNSSAPYQHLGMTAVRAVENRIWLARAANTGVSALINPRGEVVASSDLFVEALVVGEVFPGSGSSLYRQVGDLLPWCCLLLTLFWAGRAWRCKRSPVLA